MKLENITAKTIKDYLNAQATKIMGVLIAIFLIGINLYIGVFMATLVTNTRDVEIEEGVSLPIIRKNDYDRAKTDIVRRDSKQLQYISTDEDPFDTTGS